MSRCKNDVLMNKIGLNKITDRTEVEFTILNDLPDCKKINTRNVVSPNPNTYVYKYYTIPVNRFDCMRNGCVNTGTLMLVPESEDPAQVVFRIPYDPQEFAAGIITMYVLPGEEQTFPFTFDVKLSSEAALTNSDVYSITINSADVKDDGFAPVAIDLSSTPTSTTGNGWVATSDGAFIGVSAAVELGVSSIAIFDDIEDFETTDVVVVGCISDLSGSFDVPATTSRCWGASYDTSSLSFDRTITGNKVTPNYWKLNPLHGKTSVTTSWTTSTVEKTIVAYGGGQFGAITLTDMNQDECGFLGIQISDACNVTDSMMKRLVLPSTNVVFDERHYVTVANADGSTTVYFHSRLIGQKVIVTYPKAVPVERIEGNKENVGGVRVRMAYKIGQTDGAEFIYTFNNVLITSFPATITTDETEFSFTVSIQPDDDGNYYTIDRVIV